MSKRAEQFARTLYTPWSEDGMNRKDNTEVIEACIKGYEQAEAMTEVSRTSYIHGSNDAMKVAKRRYD